MLNYVLF